MADIGSGTLTFSGTIVGYPSGDRVINVSFPIVSSVDDAMPITLTVGDNVINIPGGANGVIIDPPPGNSVIVLLQGEPGDLGIGLHQNFPTIWMIPASQVSFNLNAPSAPPGAHQLTYF